MNLCRVKSAVSNEEQFTPHPSAGRQECVVRNREDSSAGELLTIEMRLLLLSSVIFVHVMLSSVYLLYTFD